MIASDRIDGTDVYAKDGEKLGTVRKLMIDKEHGQVTSAVIGFGGLFGMGEDHYPIPWEALNYDARKGAYVTSFDRKAIDPGKAPRFSQNKEPEWTPEFERTVRLYYFPTT